MSLAQLFYKGVRQLMIGISILSQRIPIPACRGLSVMKYNQENVIKIIDDAILNVKNEIEHVNILRSDPLNKEVLIKIMSILNRMRLNVEDPERHQEVRDTGLGYYITDGWPLDDSLGLVILNASQMYEKYLKKRAGQK